MNEDEHLSNPSTSQSCSENSDCKKLKNNESKSEVPSQVEVAGPANTQTPSIFRLTIDCCDEIFDYLSLKDLQSFGQTCKAMQKVAGAYFQRNFQGAEKFIEDDGIYTEYVTNKRARTSVFNRFTEFLSYYYSAKQPLQYVDWHIDEFTSVKHLYIVCTGLDSTKMRSFQPILPNLEILQIRQCILWRDDLYEMFLKQCKRLKRLYIQDDIGYIIQNRGNWLLRSYPTLEHIELTPRGNPKIDGLQQFFELNPNVQSFCTTSDAIYANRTELMEVNVKLDWLEVKHVTVNSQKMNMKTFCDLLNQFYQRGFYKRLHFQVPDVDEKFSSLLVSLHGLEKLTIEKFTNSYNLLQLEHLKELNILGYSNPSQFELLAKNLTNVERVLLQGATYNDILPFIRYSTKLKHFKVLAEEAKNFKGDVVNLKKLNKERESLLGARKLIIYIEDNVYLATKWTTQNGDTNLNMIEMKRSNAICWDYDYSTIRTLH